MTFTELVTEILLITKRPDWDARARSALRAQTLLWHRTDKYWADLATVPVTGLTSDFTQALDIATWFPNFRQLASVESCDIVQFGDLLDENGFERTNIALMAGTSLNIKRNVEITSVTVTYFRDPVVSPENLYSSWIADRFPDLLINASALDLLGKQNETEIAQFCRVQVAAQAQSLKMCSIEGQGR